MAIEKHTTEGLVLEAYDQGEHDKAFKVFTRDFGLLICHAKGIRKLESKLRAHMLPRSFSLITLVQGREVWRLVGAEGRHGNDTWYIHEVTQILGRFIKGEGSHKALYDRVKRLAESLPLFDEQKVRLLLYFVVFVDLGYADATVIGIQGIDEYKKMTIDELYTHLLLNHTAVRAHVLTVLKETQL